MVEEKKKVGRPRKKPVKKDIVEEVREEARKELAEKEAKENPKTVEDTKPPEVPFINATRLRFVDISYEHFRQYLYPNGAKIEIVFPLKLSIDKSGIHRVFGSDGLSYFIPPNWIALVTKPKPGGPNFVM